MAEQRLQKLIAIAGVASRRQAERLIEAGRVTINGRVVTQLGSAADPDHDVIAVNGVVLSLATPKLYLLLHKPKGVVSTCDDPEGRPTVLSCLDLKLQAQRLYPVGRLDTASTGALLLTNDGDLTLKLTHPRYHLSKVYVVEVMGKPSAVALEQWRQGLELEGKRTLPTTVQVLRQQSQATTLKIVMHEGRNRQIRKVAELLGHPVRNLKRVAIGPILLADLPPGQTRPLTAEELRRLRKAVGE